MLDIKISGHRGYRGKEIENTKAAFLRAIKEGLDYVEFDVRRTKDGVLVIFHDNKINRLLNGNGKIEKLNINELKSYHYEDGQEILTLKEFFELSAGKIKFIMDIKSKGIENAVISMIKKFNIERDVIVQSFLGNIIKKYHVLAPDLTYCLYRVYIGNGLIPRAFFTRLFYRKLIDRYPIQYISLDGPFMYDRFISLLNERGIKIILGAMKTEKYLKNVDKWKIAIINADNPQKIKELLKLG